MSGESGCGWARCDGVKDGEIPSRRRGAAVEAMGEELRDEPQIQEWTWRRSDLKTCR
jgi:hypothetical protein